MWRALGGREPVSGLCLAEDRQDVVFPHQQVLVAIDLNRLASVAAEQDVVDLAAVKIAYEDFGNLNPQEKDDLLEKMARLTLRKFSNYVG